MKKYFVLCLENCINLETAPNTSKGSNFKFPKNLTHTPCLAINSLIYTQINS